MKLLLNSLFIIIIASFFGCSTTRIYVENSDIDIYVNNSYKGKGTVYIPQTGLPAKKTITAKYYGKEIYKTDIRRRFSLMTGLSGCMSYGIGWVVCWQFPEQINIPISSNLLQPIQQTPQLKQNIWMRPPKVWN